MKLASSHTSFYVGVCVSANAALIRLPYRPGGAAGECLVRSRALHGGGVHQREARHGGEHPAGDRLHQQRLVRKTQGGGGGEGGRWGCLFNCRLRFLSSQQKLFDRHGVASVERHKDPSGR